jgi:hypothetical protein
MKNKLLFIALFTFTVFVARAQVGDTVFNPATYLGTLPANMELDTFGTAPDDTIMVKIVLDGWNNFIPIDTPITVSEAEEFICMTKYQISAGNDSVAIGEVNTFLKLANSVTDADGNFTVEIGANGFGSTEDFVIDTVSVSNQGTIATFQCAGQITASGDYQWGAISGDTMWVGAVVVYPARTAAETVDTLLVDYEVDVVNVRNDSDYSCIAEVTWDWDSLYVKFTVLDDTIYNDGGNIWEQDNIEFYLDMDNSKGDAFDEVDDFQFRLANDSTWEAFNSVGGVRLISEITLDGSDTIGYTFDLALPFDSIVVGDTTTNFEPAIGAQIGFDILASDNDGTPDNRDQSSWNSISGDLWNTPYYWGVLQLEEGGKVAPVEDTEAPSTVSDLAGECVNEEAVLSWTAATDNSHVASYIVTQDGSAIDTVTSTGLTVGELTVETTYTFGVTAVDLYGNEGEEETVDVEIVATGIEDPVADAVSVYPNPTTGELNIAGVENISLVEVYSLSGSIVKTFVDITSSINVSDLNNGLYIMKIHTADDVYSTRFIKD